MTAINSPPLCCGGRIFTDFARCNCFSKNLGLGEGSALPVGVPVPWPSATPPTGWLKCNGAAFTVSQYPKLARAYPALRLPDLRGEFIRGWDDGRGVDSGRDILTSQTSMIGPHNHDIQLARHCCKVSDEAAFCLIQRPYISKTLLTRRISPRGSP
ncbi:phage tail protein [Klebsiella pneumoniae]|uniref:phage tail protein n=1 Tax=Klebsiella pneumoniae TaxID=573 RepID=UPI003F6DC3D4